VYSSNAMVHPLCRGLCIPKRQYAGGASRSGCGATVFEGLTGLQRTQVLPASSEVEKPFAKIECRFFEQTRTVGDVYGT
jgi:hypothetical protein